jgi:hypothetical protein
MPATNRQQKNRNLRMAPSDEDTFPHQHNL